MCVCDVFTKKKKAADAAWNGEEREAERHLHLVHQAELQPHPKGVIVLNKHRNTVRKVV